MKLKRSRIFAVILCFAMLGLSVSCSKEEKVVQTLSEQIQGDWKLVQCNETYIIVGSSEVYPTYEIGGLWKFFMGTDSPIGEIWINGVHKLHYIISGDMIRIYNDNTSDEYDRYTLEIINGNTMRLKNIDSGELKLEFSRI